MTPPESTVGDFHTPEQETGRFSGDRNVYWESNMTICQQWAWKPNDRMKSLNQCIDLLVTNAGYDGNFMLNVGDRCNQRRSGDLAVAGASDDARPSGKAGESRRARLNVAGRSGGSLAAGNGRPPLGTSLALAGSGGVRFLDTLHDPSFGMALDPTIGQQRFQFGWRGGADAAEDVEQVRLHVDAVSLAGHCQ